MHRFFSSHGNVERRGVLLSPLRIGVGSNQNRGGPQGEAKGRGFLEVTTRREAIRRHPLPDRCEKK